MKHQQLYLLKEATFLDCDSASKEGKLPTLCTKHHHKIMMGEGGVCVLRRSRPEYTADSGHEIMVALNARPFYSTEPVLSS